MLVVPLLSFWVVPRNTGMQLVITLHWEVPYKHYISVGYIGSNTENVKKGKVKIT
jgi:hypothetical protein